MTENSDFKYKLFVSKLIPNIHSDNIIGVRSPIIKKYAKDIYNSFECSNFLNELPHKYLEENLLHSHILNLYNNVDKLFLELDKFLIYVDNWSVCDSIIVKCVKKDLSKTYNYILKCLESNHPYKIRFGIITLMRYYLDDNFDVRYNDLISNIISDEYYVNMAISWYFSFALIKQYDSTIEIFENKRLNKWVHNKSIQKAIESLRVSDEEKKYLKSLKIK